MAALPAGTRAPDFRLPSTPDQRIMNPGADGLLRALESLQDHVGVNK